MFESLNKSLKEPFPLKYIKEKPDEIIFSESLLFPIVNLVLGSAFLYYGLSIPGNTADKAASFHHWFFSIAGSITVLAAFKRIFHRSHLAINLRAKTYILYLSRYVKSVDVSGPLADIEGIRLDKRFFFFKNAIISKWHIAIQFAKLDKSILITSISNEQKSLNVASDLSQKLDAPVIFWNGGAAATIERHSLTKPLDITPSPSQIMHPLPAGSTIKLIEERSTSNSIVSRHIVLSPNKYTIGLILQQITGLLFVIIGLLLPFVATLNGTLSGLSFALLPMFGIVFAGTASSKMEGSFSVIEDAESLLCFRQYLLFGQFKRIGEIYRFLKDDIHTVSIKPANKLFGGNRKELHIGKQLQSVRMGRDLRADELKWLHDMIVAMIGRRDLETI